MKKLLSKLLCLLLALTLCLTFVACGDEEDGGANPGEEIIVPNGTLVDSAVVTLSKLGVANDAIDSSKQLMLAENGTSNYQIVIPENYSNAENNASLDLQRFVKESLGVTLKIVYDNEIGSTDNKQYLISIGKTTLLEEYSKTDELLKPNLDEIKENGQIIAIRGNLIFITGANNSGTYSAMVSFIEKELNFEQYAVDEYVIDKLDKQVVYNFGTFKYTPNVQFNLISGGVVNRSTVQERFRQRLCAESGNGGSDGNGGSLLGLYSHTIGTQILSKSNKDYFPDGTHLCLTNEDAFEAMAQELFRMIRSLPVSRTDTITYELGMPDDFGKCGCARCNAYYKTHIDSEAYLNCLNHVAKRLKEYLEETNSKIRVYVMGLMYNLYEKPPVSYNEITEEYEPFNEDIYVEDLLQIRYTPIASCQGHAWNDPRCDYNSQSTIHYVNGWASIAKNMSLWNYGYIFHGIGGALVFPDFQAVDMLAEYHEEHPFYLNRIQGSGTVEKDRPFSELKHYLLGKKFYDNEYNFDVLYNKFFANYYKVAAPAMEKYLNITLANFDAISDKKGYNGCIDSWFEAWRYDDAEDWPFELLIALDDCIKEAYELIENSNLDAKTKAILVDRVESDSLMHRTFLIGNYQSNFSATEYSEMLNDFHADCEKHGFSNRSGK